MGRGACRGRRARQRPAPCSKQVAYVFYAAAGTGSAAVCWSQGAGRQVTGAKLQSRRLESRERRRIRRSASGALTVRATVGNAWRQGRQAATIYARAQPRGGATFSLSSGRELISAAGCSSQCCWQEWSVHQHGGRGVVRRGRGRGVGARAAAAAGGQSAAAHSCRAAAAGGRRRQMRA